MWPAFSRLSANAIIPARGSAAAAGYDLSAAKDVIVPAHGKALVPTDLAIKVPDDCYGRVGMFDTNRPTLASLHLLACSLSFLFHLFCTAPRSGLSWKHHLDVGAGVIDSDYRGNVGVVLFNHAATDFPSASRHLPSHIHATNCISHFT
jgi:dUTP pyrophosphatase